MSSKNRDGLGLPPRIFFYTPDQLATMLQVDITYVEKTLLYYSGREPGVQPRTKMMAVNVAPQGETPVWRVSEGSLIRYLKAKGIKFYERGYGF